MQLLFCFFEENVLAQSRVKLSEFDLALDGFLVLTSPDNMLGLRRLKFDDAVL